MKNVFNRALVGQEVAVVVGAKKADRLANYVELYFGKEKADFIRQAIEDGKFDDKKYAVNMKTGDFGKAGIYEKRNWDVIGWSDCLREKADGMEFNGDLLGTETAVICTAEKAVLLAGRLLAGGYASEEDYADLIENKDKFDGTVYAVNLTNGKYGKKSVYQKKDFSIVKYNDCLSPEYDDVEEFEYEEFEIDVEEGTKIEDMTISMVAPNTIGLKLKVRRV